MCTGSAYRLVRKKNNNEREKWAKDGRDYTGGEEAHL